MIELLGFLFTFIFIVGVGTVIMIPLFFIGVKYGNWVADKIMGKD